MSKKPLITEATIGADIEVFLQHRESKAIVSAEGIIKGTKTDPFKFKEGNPYFATSLDNVMAEFCIPPAKTKDDFKFYIHEALGWIEGFIPKELTILAAASAHVDNIYLQTPNAIMFGCDPDYNAWALGVMNDKPIAEGGLRSCGGHIHVGYAEPSLNTSLCLIRAMDIFLGLPSILQEPDSDRKRLYGKAGAYRQKPYGAEYRTISNYYVANSLLMDWAYDGTMAAIDFVNSGISLDKGEGDAIQAAINFNDKRLAETMCSYFGVKTAKTK